MAVLSDPKYLRIAEEFPEDIPMTQNNKIYRCHNSIRVRMLFRFRSHAF